VGLIKGLFNNNKRGGSKMEKCPYCNKNDFIPEYVTRNVERYGGGVLNFSCEHCGEIVKASFRIIIEVNEISESTEENDF